MCLLLHIVDLIAKPGLLSNSDENPFESDWLFIFVHLERIVRHGGLDSVFDFRIGRALVSHLSGTQQLSA